MECDKKNFSKEKEAKQFARVFRRQGKHMTTYYCRDCKAFHLTTSKKRR